MQKQLKEFLTSQERPDGTMNYNELCGFLFAITCSPELIKPSEWLPLVFNEQDPGYSDIEQAKEISEEIFALYNEINFQVQEGDVQLPADCRMTDNPSDNFTGPLGEWSAGFMNGHSWLIDLWDSYTPDELGEELGTCIMIMSYFSDPKLAETYRKEATRKSTAKDELEKTVTDIFDKAMNSYAHLGRSIYSVISEQSGNPNQPHIQQKTGRNAPCPCGSGKKYKHCCLH